jgi:hypothetical protein
VPCLRAQSAVQGCDEEHWQLAPETDTMNSDGTGVSVSLVYLTMASHLVTHAQRGTNACQISDQWRCRSHGTSSPGPRLERYTRTHTHTHTHTQQHSNASTHQRSIAATQQHRKQQKTEEKKDKLSVQT